jgi:CRISP-associated protein Cas1
MQLILDTKDLELSRQRGLFLLTAPDGTKRTISPQKITSIAITHSCRIHTSAIELAAANEIPMYTLNALGKVIARLGGPNFQSIATLRRQQVAFSGSPDAARWVTGLYLLKTAGQIDNLVRLQKGHPAASTIRALLHRADALALLPLAEAGPRIMVLEANIARNYWQGLVPYLPAECDFEKRTRRPAQDPFNAALNYLYGMLYIVVETSLFAAGLDPHLGLLHADEYNKPVLAFDFIEPFRPWVDWLLIEHFRGEKVPMNCFTKIPNGLALGRPGKALFIPLFNEWLRSERSWDGRRASVRNHIYQLAGRYAKKLRET